MSQESEKRRIKIFRRASEIFRDPGTAKRWMACPIPFLNGATPIDLSLNEDGFETAMDVLFQIKNGVYC